MTEVLQDLLESESVEIELRGIMKWVDDTFVEKLDDGKLRIQLVQYALKTAHVYAKKNLS